MVLRETHGSESDLVLGLISKSPEALAIAYDRYGSMVYSILIRITRNPSISEDLTQEAFLRVWTRSREFDMAKGKLGVWIVAITRNLAIDFVRSAQHRTSVGIQPQSLIRSDAEIAFADVDVSRKMLASLTSVQREILELAYFEGCSQKEIAERLKTPVGTIKSRMRAALQQLRMAFSELGLPQRSMAAKSVSAVCLEQSLAVPTSCTPC